MSGDEVDAVLLFQQLGRAAVPGPVIEHMVAAPLLAGTPLAGGVADGTTVVTACLDGDPFVAHADVADVVLTADGWLRGVLRRSGGVASTGPAPGAVSGGIVDGRRPSTLPISVISSPSPPPRPCSGCR